METTEKRKKRVVIEDGNFTDAGNFSAYDENGERYHIHKRQLDNLGWKKPEDVKFPFYAIAIVRPIGQLDENDEPVMNADGTPYQIDRLQIGKVFASREEYIQRQVDKQSVDIEIRVGVRDAGVKAGLDEKTVNQLVNAI